MKRYVSIWFTRLKTDWQCLQRKELTEQPFVLSLPDHGRKIVSAVSPQAEAQGIRIGMSVADAKALARNIFVLDDDTVVIDRLLHRLAHWCIRFTPVVMMDAPDGLLLDASGCTHLWGGEELYLKELLSRLRGFGFSVRVTIADTIGTAWAVARFTRAQLIVPPGENMNALLPLPPAALRIDDHTCQQLHKLGLRQIKNFIGMPRASLQRRFGDNIIHKIGYALGHEPEIRPCVITPATWEERLPCLEPIATAAGIEIALDKLLTTLCERLQNEGKGLRSAIFRGYRIDGKTVSLTIGTNKATHNKTHLLKLFTLKFETLAPGPGIELFTLEAQKTETVQSSQSGLWAATGGLQDEALAELLDRLTVRFGEGHFHRFLPDEHHWPERAVKATASLTEKSPSDWMLHRPRPVQLLPKPERIEVAAPVPDYPPMHFRHNNKLHKVVRADGPERIEQEWWLTSGEHRDYYCLEDEEGRRYWVFRLGHYEAQKPPVWFLHGYFA